MMLICFADFMLISKRVLLIVVIPMKFMNFFFFLEVLPIAGHWWCLLGGQNSANDNW